LSTGHDMHFTRLGNTHDKVFAQLLPQSIGVIIVDKTREGVLVVGGSGHQGAAAVRYLQQRDVPVHAVVRDLADDASSLSGLLGDAEALLMFFDDASAGPAERLRQGKAIGQAARRAGVDHVVLSAASAADHHLAACDQSHAIEDHWRGLGLAVTVVRAATLMEEIPWYWLSRFGGQAELAAPYPAATHLSWVASADVGALAAMVAATPRRFRGRNLRVAGDVASPEEVAALLAELLGEPVRYSEVQVEGVFMDLRASERPADIELLRGLYPGLHTLRTWLARGGGLELCRRAMADNEAQAGGEPAGRGPRETSAA